MPNSNTTIVSINQNEREVKAFLDYLFKYNYCFY